ncbi:MAG: bifunctional molybdopterin-guanine dinucleotide biosynthesis adaptor protein MobB/molybdopterin molybdotransferase MoeA [Aeromonas sp.]
MPTRFSVFPVSVLGFAAWSGTGKTTLLEQLIPALVARGVRLGVLKHAHHDFDTDQPGKDSYRLRKAGAAQVMAASRYRHALICETPAAEPSFAALRQKFDERTLDLLLIEGFKAEDYPKIELHRAALGKPWLYPDDRRIIALASDVPPAAPCALPLLDLNEVSALTDFVCAWLAAQNAAPALPTAAKACAQDLSVTAARAAILSALPAYAPRVHALSLEACLGHVLAADLISPLAVPPHANAAMDGIGLRSDDLAAGRWQLVGTVLAGARSDLRLAPGQAVRIMTGAALPAGVDTVVMREEVAEETSAAGTWVSVRAPLTAGQHVRSAGEDLAQGAVALGAGTRLGAAALGLAASLGQTTLNVQAPLTVALFSTGDEVQAPGQPLAAGQIFDSNRTTLHALARQAGATVLDLGIIEDSPAALRAALTQAAAKADVVLSSGGVSVGTADYIKTVLADLGQVNFWRIAMRPGRPLAFGLLPSATQIGGVPFFGLPGNPVAAMIGFLLFVAPALCALRGQTWQPERLPAFAAEPLRSRLGRSEFLRGVYHARADGRLSVRTTGAQGSGILRSMHAANCLIELLPEQAGAGVDERVWIWPLAPGVS